MKRHRLLVLLSAMTLLAMGVAASPASAEATPERSVNGVLTGSAYNIEPGAPEFLEFCEAGDWALTHTEVMGEVTHLGLTESIEFWHCFAGGPLEGAVTFAAANGDTLGGAYIGDLMIGEEVRAEVEVTIDHGTGRFDDVSGTIYLDVLVLPSPTGVNVEVELSGMITY